MKNNDATTVGSNPVLTADTPIEKGNILLDLYKVESDPIVGGMGRVFRIRHTGWNTDLAMKQPKKELFRNEAQKQAFIHECDAWINLGLHPHIVSCYYVREIGGIPSIFSEWMDGGSLKGFIDSGTLYKGDEEAALERILDISIQFARGLHYAHEQKLIHQDVKPDNLLLSKTGEAKVADFGLSDAKTILGAAAGNARSGTGTIISESGGYTPAYCSPEQIKGRELTRRTDIWSWAVSVLEMFVGERPWNNGVLAGMACENYFDMTLIPISKAMKDLLRHCFRENEAKRPHDFKEIETVLLQIYHDSTGKAYARPEPKAAADTADSLNNKALSYLDMERPEEAEKCWEQALTINSAHTESLYNQSIHLWKNAKIDDMDALRTLNVDPTKMTDCYLTKIHLSRGDAESALTCLNKAKDTFGETDDIRRMVAAAHEMIEKGKDGKCIRTLKEYDSNTNSVCFSPDGKTALSGSEDKTIKLWEIETERLTRMFKGHTSEVESVCFSPDGKMALSGSQDKTIKLWEIETERCIRTFKGHTGKVYSVCFSPDGKMALSGSDDETIKLWEVMTGQCIRTFKGDTGYNSVNSVCFSPDGKTVLSGGWDKTIKLWEVKTGICIRTFKGHSNYIRSVCFSPDGKTALSGSKDKTIKLWEVKTGICIRTFKGHSNYIQSVCFSPDGKTVLSGSWDETIKLWEVETGRCIRTFVRDNCHIYSVCFSPNGRTVLSGGIGEIKLWLIPDKPNYEMMIVSEVTSTVKTLHHAEQFDSLAVEARSFIQKGNIADALNTLREMSQIPLFGKSIDYFTLKKSAMRYCVCNKITNQKNQIILQNVNSVCFSPDGQTALSGSEDGSIKLWEVETGVCVQTFEGNNEAIRSVCFSPDGETALSGGRDYISSTTKLFHIIRRFYTIKLWEAVMDALDYYPNLRLSYTIKQWEVATGKCIRTFKGHNSSINSVCFSPDGKTVLSGSNDKIIKLWEVETGTCIRTFKGHSSYIESVCFSSDGKTALSGSRDKTIKLWNVMTGKRIRTFKGHNNWIKSVCFSPDGKTALSGSWDNTIKLWEVKTGKCIRTFKGHNDWINSVCFSPDGKTALSGSHDNTIKLWEVATGQCIHTFKEHTNKVYSVSFSPDGTNILSGGGHEIIIYDLDYDLTFPGWADWDEGARPYLEIFRTLHPTWTDEDFNNILIPDLQRRGYGWLRPEGVKAILEGMTDIKPSFWQRLTGAKN